MNKQSSQGRTFFKSSFSGTTMNNCVEVALSPEEITVFKSLGLAVEDLAAAGYVLSRAEAENAGTVVSL